MSKHRDVEVRFLQPINNHNDQEALLQPINKHDEKKAFPHPINSKTDWMDRMQHVEPVDILQPISNGHFHQPINKDIEVASSEPDEMQCTKNAIEKMNGVRSRTKPRPHLEEDVHEAGLLEVVPLQHGPNKRRLSQGDDPHWLQQVSESDCVGSLMGRANKGQGSHKVSLTDATGDRSHKIRVTEVAPSTSSIRKDEPGGWKMPIELFTSKKQLHKNHHKSRHVRCYYKKQDDLITAFEDIALEVDIDMSQNNPYFNYKKAVLYSKVTFFVNVLLTVAKVVASVLSGSIAIISSLVDSALDLFSGVIMWWATRAMKRRDPYTYPQGRTKLEPVAVIILSVVMALASMQLIREAMEKLASLARVDTSLPNVDVLTFAISGSTVVVKLALWSVCRKVKSSVVRALAQDHRNDVVSNTAAIVCGYLGSRNFNAKSGMYGFAYVDPVGAIAISVYIILNWWKTGSEQIKMLTGHTARPGFLSKLTWVCVNHHAKISQIDTVRAFHFGNNFLVEVDIVLPADMRLQEAHDIGESLQHRLESLDEVERAFVHLDYESTHSPQSEHKIV